MSGQLFLVHLRRPHGADDARADPWWEYGSFGLTGCHRTNLLHPSRSRVRAADQLAFVQGGPTGTRLLFVTPPVVCRVWRDTAEPMLLEITWDRRARPLRYGPAAPLLAGCAEQAPADLPELRKYLRDVGRTSACGKFASRFRARCEPLTTELAGELRSAFRRAVAQAYPEDFVRHYTDAVPGIDPRHQRAERHGQFRALKADLRALGWQQQEPSGRRRCRRGMNR